MSETSPIAKTPTCVITNTTFTSHPNGEITYKNLTIEARCPTCGIIDLREYGDGNLKNLIGKPIYFYCLGHGEFSQTIDWEEILPKQRTWEEHLHQILYWYTKIKLAPNTSDHERKMLTISYQQAKTQHPDNIFLQLTEEIVTAHGK